MATRDGAFESEVGGSGNCLVHRAVVSRETGESGSKSYLTRPSLGPCAALRVEPEAELQKGLAAIRQCPIVGPSLVAFI